MPKSLQGFITIDGKKYYPVDRFKTKKQAIAFSKALKRVHDSKKNKTYTRIRPTQQSCYYRIKEGKKWVVYARYEDR